MSIHILRYTLSNLNMVSFIYIYCILLLKYIEHLLYMTVLKSYLNV